jgi:hypothetical protein
MTGEKKWFTMYFTFDGSQTVYLAVASCYARDRAGRLWYHYEQTENILQLKTDNHNGDFAT